MTTAVDEWAKQREVEEKAKEYLGYVIEDVQDLISGEGDYEDWSDMEVSERVMEWEASSVLSIEGLWKGFRKDDAELDHVMVTLATGGPAYGLKITPTYGYNNDIQFWYQDWWIPKHYINLVGQQHEAFEYIAENIVTLIDY